PYVSYIINYRRSEALGGVFVLPLGDQSPRVTLSLENPSFRGAYLFRMGCCQSKTNLPLLVVTVFAGALPQV
ncbi:MAG: hypothetical protein WD558_06240, partial [Pseudomonadales bacterium]